MRYRRAFRGDLDTGSRSKMRSGISIWAIGRGRRAGEGAMASDEKVLRTLHLKFTLPAADPAQLSAMIKSAKPFYDFFGTTRVHLLHNVDDPARFIQVIEYETDEPLEA